MNKTFFKDINSWDDFDHKLSSLNNKEKGDAFELLTKCYFKIKPQYNHYDEVWLLDEVPQNELDYLKISDDDFGIDLIAKEGKEYYAIQCKYHGDKNKNVTYTEVATFLSQVAANKRFTMGYLCSSGIDTSKNYQKVQKKEIQEILADSWQLLDKVFFNNVRKLLNNKTVKEKPFEPRKHQEKAISQALNHFVKENNSRGKLIFPCGAGKSLTGYWLSEALKSKSTIIAVPSLALVKQTLEVYLREIVANGIKVKWLCICSDEGIGASDDVAIMTNNIGVPCKTDPAYIRAWLKENKDEHKIIFTTYQSGHLIADISKKLKMSFDLGIFDEAHKTVGSSLKKFSYLLFEKNIKINRRIFMTATERFYSGSKEDIISMDDEDVYGDTFAQMSFKEAIDLELLTDYKVITIDIKKSEIADFIKENNLVQLNDKWKKETEARSLASMLAMRKAMKRFNIKNVVSFHSSIEKAKRNKDLQEYITETYNYKPIDTYTVSGKIPTTKRNIIVQEFAKSDRALITNARCLTEGIDVPNIDCIVFADPRKSKVDIVQALGRALRKKEGKDWGYVILPVVYDGDTNEIDNDSFNEIVSIVRGLAANDERIVEYFKDKAQKGRGSGDIIKGSNLFSLDSSMLEEKDLASQLQIKIWEKLSKFAWMAFEEARNIVWGLGLKNTTEWRDYCKSDRKPSGIPTYPRRIYKNKGFISIQDWLGTRPGWDGYEYLPFEEARSYVWKFNLQNSYDWLNFCKTKKPMDIPGHPRKVYKNDGWLSMEDWLGTRPGWDGNWLTYEDAKKFVSKLNLTRIAEWEVYKNTNKIPVNLPKAPRNVYKDKGWISWGDFLGTDRIADKLKKDIWWDFETSRDYVRKLGFKTVSELKKFMKTKQRPLELPTNPDKIYKEFGWINFSDYLGTDAVASQDKRFKIFWNYEKSRDYVISKKINNHPKFNEFVKSKLRPEGLPTNPATIYKNNGWKGWSHFFDIKHYVKTNRLSYKKAKEKVRKYNFKSIKEFTTYYKKNPKEFLDVPLHPQQSYGGKYGKKTWQGWNDFLGNLAVKKYEYLEFEKAREYVRKLKLRNQREWIKFCKSSKRPQFIPYSPERTYKDKGWKGLTDWLGSEEVSRFLDFNDSRKLIHKKKINTKIEWRQYCKLDIFPKNIPKNPHLVYKGKGWINYRDWFGTKHSPSKKICIDYKTAKKIISKHNIKSNKEWRVFDREILEKYKIPFNPDRYYKDKGWKGWKDFLGNE